VKIEVVHVPKHREEKLLITESLLLGYLTRYGMESKSDRSKPGSCLLLGNMS
jgi:hypothetical protein